MSSRRNINTGSHRDRATVDDQTSQIVAGLRSGRPEAWSGLYEVYAERVWHVVARLMGRNVAEVADVVQEVFLAASASARRFDPARGSLWMWLLGIVRHQVALYWRRHGSRIEHARRWWATLDGDADQWLAGTADAPADALESEELAALIRATLLELPTEYQTLLISRYVDDTAATEIARQTKSTPDAVRAKLMRARRAFRSAFRELASGEPDLPGRPCHEPK